MSQNPEKVVDQSQPSKPTPTSDNQTHPTTAPHSTDYAPYPKLDPNDVAPPPPQQQSWTTVPTTASGEPRAPISESAATSMPNESNPYVSAAPAPTSSKNTMDSVKDVLGKWGKKAADATKKAEDLAGNMWQHLKTGPSFADAAVGRIAQQTKIIAEGGYEKVFRQSFESSPEEQLKKTYACYLSTSSGPIMGVLYLSTAKLAFCSDNPLSYQVGDKTEWSYYKVVLPLHQLRAVNPSTSKVNASEKYIQIISIDNHEFWFMGFVHYDSAVKNLQGAVQSHTL